MGLGVRGATTKVFYALLGAVGAVAGGHVEAQGFPNKPIRMLLPYPPGGSADFVGRPLVQPVSERLGQQVVIDNRGGGGGAIAMEVVAQAQPDGYTIVLGMTPQVAANVSLYPNLQYNPVRDFSPVSLLVSQPYLLVVHSSIPANNVQELVALAKARAGKLVYWSSGNGGIPHLSMELFKTMTQVDMLHIPYKGGGPAYPDFLAGRTHLTFASIGTAGPHVRAGKLKALAISSRARNKAVPEIPTVAESGVAGYESLVWYGVLAPRGTPRPVVDRLHRDFTESLKNDDVVKRYVNNGLDIIGSTPEHFATFIAAEIKKWADVVKRSGAKID
jgi:tripartite-type tricarboxylate transporter receptor subunit TctC